VLLPFHKAVEAHAIAGTAALVFGAIHVGAYGAMYLVAPEVFRGAAYPSALATGVALTVLLGMLAWGASVRKRGRFEAFYLTHFLTIPIAVLLLVHAPLGLAILGAPLLLFLLDRVSRVAWMSRSARIERVAVDGRDIDLVIARPQQFSYQAGDYAFLCAPAISRLQWHPFSLVNAPSAAGSLSFRIRRAGSWTTALADMEPGTVVFVDGPFASPCRDLYGCRRAIVVAAGIGITPFASFLAEVHERGPDDVPFDRLALYWSERDEGSFHGFRQRVDALVGELPGKFTANLSVGRGIDWEAELARLAHDDDLRGATLFFCGPPALSGVLRSATRRHGFRFRTESF
jgi:predicted ferric reductase